ncbi:MAG: transglycosylase domain-containing protein, partial [Lachnospiraceae bacterium]|nr:transglycosylase domain-containing protein [Lachnospiraceae bacterium]
MEARKKGTASNRSDVGRAVNNRNGNGSGNARSAANTSRDKKAAAQQAQTKAGKGKKAKKRKRFPKLRFAFKVSFLVLLLGVLAGLVVFYFKFGDDLIHWKNEAKQLVDASNEKTFRSSETSIIYNSQKKPIANLKGDKDSSYIKFADIPKAAIDCMVVSEDRDFYEHGGVNFLSTAKATALYVKGKIKGDDSITRGGSTITQQLVKNVFLSNEKTEERKIREIFIAMEMEKKYTKDEIMEFYLNVICFANAHFGIEAASKAYFSKSVKDLDLAEIAFLCAIPNRPSTYDPLEHFDNTVERKNRILEQLLEEKKITATEFSDAKYEDIVLNPAQNIKTQDYMTTFAISCATKSLMKKYGFEFQSSFANDGEREEYDKKYKTAYDECHSMLYTGGYRIYTTLNNSKQKNLQKAVNDALAGFTEKTKDGVYTLQGAATCIDNETGFVVAVVGGRRQKSITGYTLNRAFQSFRQPGSSFKPLVVYTPQLEREYTPDTIVDDSPFEDGPKNSDGTYAGKIPLRTAVEKSKNVVAWKLFEELTPRIGLSYVEKMNFSKIVDNDYYPAASLGGLTNGASTVEMASAYATIENDGVYREPTCVRKITNSEGEVILDNKKEQEQIQIYEETAARMMTDILSGVLVRGTARGHALSNDMACAGKTGTTSDKKDGWFCGFTPYYTTAVWVGCDSPRTIDNLYGNTFPLTIWYNYMEELHQGLEPKQFEEYAGKPEEDSYDYEEEEDPEETEEPEIDPDALEATAEPEEPEETKKPKVTKEPEDDE